MIITIYITCFNAAETLSLLLSDLSNQTDQGFNVVVVDAKSSDHTLNILQKYKKQLRLRYISEPDDGIYYGLNKAIDLINKSHCLCLGADDRVLNKRFIEILNEKITDQSAIYYTDVFLYNGFNSRLKRYPMPEKFKKAYGGLAHLHHQTALIPSWFLKDYKYNTSYSTYSDLDLMLKAQSKLILRKLSVSGVYFSTKGKSGSYRTILPRFSEILLIRKRNGLRGLNLCILRTFLRQILGV